MKVVIAQCTNAKRDDTTTAARLYDESNYFCAQRHYARTADKWAIQSAKHGLVWPHEEIAPYDKTPADIDDTDEWAEDIAGEIAHHIPTSATIEILGGKAYADPLTPALERRAFEVYEPLRGLGIGERMAELNRRSREVLNAGLHG